MRPWQAMCGGLLMGLALVSWAASPVSAQQTGTIAGTVTDSVTQAPLQGAQVYIVGTTVGALTDESGRYLLNNVPVGDRVIRVQLMGYSQAEQQLTVTAGSSQTVNLRVRQTAVQLAPVVVTALGIEREERGLGFATQNVSEEQLARTPEVNLVQALQGQTAGVQVVQSSGRPGASSRINIRGQTTFTGSGQPLFIIDGVPVSTDLDNYGLGALGSGSAGNRAMDFDLSNVSDISVLRGAAATALYGSRAAAGAVIITTKQGRPGSDLRFDYSSSMSFATPIIEGYVTDWAAGVDRLLCDGRLESQGGYCEAGYPGGFETSTLGGSGYPNWGPHKDSIPADVLAALGGSVRFEDARKQYYQTAHSLENSLRASGSVGSSGFYTFGVSYLDQGDITPTGKLERLNLSANVTLRFSDYLSSNTSLQRINTHNPWPIDSWSGIHHTLLHVPPNVDIREGYLDDGTPVLWGSNSPHPAWVADNEYFESNVDRWIVSQQFALNLPANLTLSNRWGLDTYLDDRLQHQNERPWRTAEGRTSGGTRQEKINRYQINNDLVLSLNATPLGTGGLTLSGLMGGNVWMREGSRVGGSGSTIVIPDYYNIENFETQRVFADLPTKQRLIGLYGQATVDYLNWAYLTVTGRNDWSSTLPKNANSYFYPSVALGLIFTEALGMHSDLLPYGKLRLSVAKVGADAPPYSLSSTYSDAGAPGISFGHYQFSPTGLNFPFQDQVGFLQGRRLGNPDIKPESTREYEVGLELRMLQHRARLDVTYYDKKSYDQIFSVPSSATSGYTSIVRNAGDLRNQGWEVSVQGRPIETQDFSLDLLANWTRNRNSVLALAPGIDQLGLAGYSWPSIRIIQDHPYGVIWGYGFQRNCVPETGDTCFQDQPKGALLIGDQGCVSDRGGTCYGYPLRTQNQMVLGEAMPNWLANFRTQLQYKGIGLSSLWDVRNGSKILNFEIQYTTGRNGRHIFTNDRYSETVVEGININTGQPNDVQLIKDPHYYELMYGYDRHENQIEPGGFVKLREVTLSLDLPTSLLNRFSIDHATLYAQGRNLGIWSDFSALDPEGDVYGGSSGATQFFRQFPAPQTRGFTIGLRAGF